MMLHHPILAIRHLMDGRVKAPKRVRLKAKSGSNTQ
jgi:hypothetical protein